MIIRINHLWIALVILLLLCLIAFAEIDVELLADCIFKAENSKSKPYGIMRDYCTPQTIDKWASKQ